ncbi:MAG: hypothetical protein M3135_03570, partial [Actinomycetota bacterium]|nr:hypothetical protein [Actinomycetota bacterium]
PEGARRVLDLEAVPAATIQSFPIADADGGIVAEVDGPRTMIVGRRMSPVAPTPPPSEDQGGGGGKGSDAGDDRGNKGGNATSNETKGKGAKGGKGDEEEAAPESTDLASTPGALHQAPRWLALPALGPDGGAGTLLIQNPTTGPVDVRVAFIGTGGPVGEEQVVTVAGTSTLQVGLPEGGPVAAIVDAGEGSVVAAQAATDPSAFAVALGVPIA